MTSSQFKAVKIAVAIILAIFVGQAAVRGNYLLAAGAAAIALVLLLILRRSVKDIMADERDYEIAGKAARYAMTVFTVAGAIGSLVLLSFNSADEIYGFIGAALAYSVCALMMLYTLIFSYLAKSLSFGRSIWYLFLASAIVAVFVLGGLRLFSGEGDWICSNGEWVKHGNPSAPMPEVRCE